MARKPSTIAEAIEQLCEAQAASRAMQKSAHEAARLLEEVEAYLKSETQRGGQVPLRRVAS